MPGSVGSQVYRWLMLLWSAFTAVYLLITSALIFLDARFPLNLGLIRTTGRVGLWVTLLPGVVGVLALLLILLRARLGALLLGAYSLFWTVVLACTLPAVWNARSSFCTQTMCIRTPWIARLLVLALATPFVLAALWATGEAGRRRTGNLPM
ncbi:MAG: hypothetical protein WCC27_17095 [Acidobacteriaceae bacterium]